jgi:hypothetical protein
MDEQMLKELWDRNYKEKPKKTKGKARDDFNMHQRQMFQFHPFGGPQQQQLGQPQGPQQVVLQQQHQVFTPQQLYEGYEAMGYKGGMLDYQVQQQQKKQNQGQVAGILETISRSQQIQGQKDLSNLELEENLTQLTSWAGEWNTSYQHANVFPKQPYQEQVDTTFGHEVPSKPTPLNKESTILKGDIKLRTWQHLDSKFPRYDDFVDPIMSTMPSKSFFYSI